MLAFVGLFDLVSAGMLIRMWTYEILPVWLVIGAVYLIWITSFSKLMNIIYEKKKIRGMDFMMQ